MSHFRYKITVPSVGLGAGDSAVKMPIELPSQWGNHKQSKQIDYRQWHEDDKGGHVIETEEWLPGTQCSEELGFHGRQA